MGLRNRDTMTIMVTFFGQHYCTKCVIFFQRAAGGPAHMLTHSLSGQHMENNLPFMAQV